LAGEKEKGRKRKKKIKHCYKTIKVKKKGNNWEEKMKEII
jgi:hypothetical protein